LKSLYIGVVDVVQSLYKISQKKSVIIIDSFNGFFNMFDKMENSGRLVSSYLMLISSAAKMSNSVVIIANMARMILLDWQMRAIGQISVLIFLLL